MQEIGDLQIKSALKRGINGGKYSQQLDPQL